MKKKIIILLLILILVFTSGCKKDEKTISLIAQFNDFASNDISSDAHFHSYINTISNDVVPGFVQVKVLERTSLNVIIGQTVTSGFIYHINPNNVYIIASYDGSYLENNDMIVSYNVLDYRNRSYQATPVDYIEEHKLIILRVSTIIRNTGLNQNYLAIHEPIIKEPLVLLSFNSQIRNYMQMGFLQEINEGIYKTSFTLDSNSLGGILISTQGTITGIVVSGDEGLMILGLNYLKSYVNIDI